MTIEEQIEWVKKQSGDEVDSEWFEAILASLERLSYIEHKAEWQEQVVKGYKMFSEHPERLKMLEGLLTQFTDEEKKEFAEKDEKARWETLTKNNLPQ